MKSPEFSASFCEEYSEKVWNSPVPMDPEIGFNAPNSFPFSNFEMGQRDDMYCSSSSKCLSYLIIISYISFIQNRNSQVLFSNYNT